MCDPEGIKSFLYTFLQTKKRIAPEYTFIEKPVGRGKVRFLCEARAEGFNYVGIGNSTTKKDAQTNAARDFVNYLVREGEVPASTVPVIKPGNVVPSEPSSTLPKNHGQSFPPQQQNNFLSSGGSYISSIYDQKKLEEAEEVDLTSDLHGGWSMENAKARLNEYLQATRQQVGQVKYTSVGPDHGRSYIAEMTVFATNLRKNLYAREAGSNKQLASRACCLSLVRQLFHAGEVEAFTGEKRKKKHTEVAVYTVELNQKVEENLTSVLGNLGLPVNLKPPTSLPPGQTYNMITKYNLVDFDDAPKQQPQLVAWCPPLPNWNPWTACNIDEGPEAIQPLSHISAGLADERLRRLDTDSQLRSLMDERAQLPVNPYRISILEAVKRNRVTIIRGETGCGKTTQIPQFILDSYLESGIGAECSILVTQPRRISAISLAERIAYERGEVVGTSVGYCVRFEAVYPRPYGSILFCTVGTMARKMEGGLRGVSHVIVDEIHERDVNTDFMLILLREMVRANRNLRLVLMSATIDITMFNEYFGDCMILDIEGRTHPVEYYFLEDCVKMVNFVPPPIDEKKRKRRQELENVVDNTDENCNLKCDPVYGDAVVRTMKEITEKEVPFELVGALLDKIISMNIPGAVLIFLPGWNIISLLRKYLQSHSRYGGPDYVILPLHSQIPREDQRLVFRSTPPGVRKIVLATNIAESSITINDIVFVIDFCLSRTKLFTARNNLTSYSTSWASKTNLEQRRGRAGRVRPGFAFHLCSRARFDRLDQHATPEILRTPLHELALLIKLLRLGSVRDFLMKALQPPPLDAVIEAEHTLKEMKALDTNDELTPLGFILARLPIEPRLGKMLIFACAFNLGGAAAVLTSTASLGCDPFLLPPDHRRLTNHQRSFAAGYSSDHLAGLNVFQVWASERNRRGDESADSFCDQHGFNSSALRIIDDAANQLRAILINLGFPEESLSDAPVDFNVKHNIDCDIINTLLVSGLYPNICFHSDKRKLLTTEGTLALIHKGSVNCIKDIKFTYPFFVFDEKIRTQAVSCKGLTMVNPIQLMLFGCRSAVWRNSDSNDKGIVVIDDWIPFRMSFTSAARIFAFRPALEALLVRTCLRPEGIADLREEDKRVINVLRQLCSPEALNPNASFDEASSYDSPPRKKFATAGNYPLLSGRSHRTVGYENSCSEKQGFGRYANCPSRFGVSEQAFDGQCGFWQDPLSQFSNQRYDQSSVNRFPGNYTSIRSFGASGMGNNLNGSSCYSYGVTPFGGYPNQQPQFTNDRFIQQSQRPVNRPHWGIRY
ncbi:ATP-dependent RNA helicase A [Schistosoma japonicum]|nr:ATP-dependent RNA helicase A [Schistosoma japonicum]KAH8854463.1 ATP-dependent RNA helicase A [Schistosoma japonicum]KAH8854464.1 ATP-dependent RNA helicase A [Schistosoma japonicum]